MRPGTANADPDRKRRRLWPWILASIVASTGFAAWAVLTGGKPLIQGERLAEGRVTVVADGFIAAYLVEPGDCVGLVDATMDPAATEILDTLRSMGRSPEDVCAIFLMHGHGDHIVGVRAFPGARVHVLAADADLVEGRRTTGNVPGRFREPVPTGIEVDVELEDGDVVGIGGVEVEMFALPGHTRGSAAYLVHGVLFLGDSAAATSTDGIAPAPPVFSWDRDVNRQSLHALAERLAGRQNDVDAMAFGHQGPLRGIGPLLAGHEDRR